MRRHTLSTLAVLAVGASVFAFVGVARAADAPATGTWKWEVERQGQTMEMTLKLKQDGDKLTGTLAGPQGEPTEIKDGKVDKDTITFRVEREFNGNVFKIDYNGKIQGDTIEGKSEIERNGEKRSRDWKAKRAS